jgi:LysR family carnitine catabolism transcriptional activator
MNAGRVLRLEGIRVNVTVRQLRAFAALAGVGSFTRAAEALHVTQPALSSQIRELEGALGVRLFDRSTRAVVLTTTGRELLPIADQILAGLDGLVSHASGVAARRIGRVSVAALPSIAATLFPEAIVRFRARHPGIGVALQDALAGGVADRVRDGLVDFGVSGAIVSDPNLSFESLGTDRMLAALPAGHPLARSRRMRLAELLEQPLILMNRDSSVRVIVDRAAAALGHVIVPAFETAFMSTATSLVRAGLGVTLLPASSSGFAELSGLVLRPVEDASLARPIGLVHRVGRSLSPAAELFAAHTRIELLAWLGRSHDARPSRRSPRSGAVTAPGRRSRRPV